MAHILEQIKNLLFGPTSVLVVRARRTLFLMGVFALGMQALEHFRTGGLTLDLHLIVEALLYLLVMPALAALLLAYLAQIERERSQKAEALDRQGEISRELAAAADWDDLTRIAVEFARFILPLEAARLFIYKPESRCYGLAAGWEHAAGFRPCGDFRTPGCPEDAPGPYACISCAAGAAAFHLTEPGEAGPLPAGRQVWCLPLHRAGQTLGKLEFELPDGADLTVGQEDTMNNAAVVLELALERSLLRSNVIAQQSANAEDRRRIAQDLHDTLGQNLAYLRLKLDALTMEEDPARQLDQIRQELTHMRDAADQAFAQMRLALADLGEQTGADLARQVRERAQLVGQRAGFELDFSETGTPLPLPAYTRRQVLYALREALNNVEKHARARRVRLSFNWLPGRLEAALEDDGQGFDPDDVDHNSHFGLEIMQERIESVGGRLNIDAAQGRSTAVRLTLPLEHK